MGKFRLAFGLHNHQPVGNFEFVFEESHQKAYQPFFDVLRDFPGVHLSLHQSGILWDWQQRNHPEYLSRIRELVNSGRLELLTGGFYEPILTSIPERDVIGQITKLNDYLKAQFNVVPQGLWLTERIWEPHLPKVLNLSGVRFLPVDDTHFVYAGLELKQLTGPFVTEHENHKVTLLPISKRLRYLIPFGTVEEVMAELRSLADQNPGGMVIYADDGEKFGSWPKTYEHCYQDRWLGNFFEALQRNSDWLEVVPLSEAAAAEPVGRVYLPTASYAEMLHWALPPKAFVEYEEFEHYLEEHKLTERFGRFVRGSHWRGFLAKYDEANLMHKKMLAVSARLEQARRDYPGKTAEINKATDHLYAGQCNCPYWHGVFGGLYLPHIRQAIYANLVAADAIYQGLSPAKRPTFEVTDFDADGFDEIIVSGRSLSAVFKPRNGGTLLELSLNKLNFSPTDTLTRRREGYHLKLDKAVTEAAEGKTASIHDLVLAKEEGLKELLVEDWYLKRCFIDHFFGAEVGFETFKSGRFAEEGDFVREPYQYELDKNTGSVTLRRDGHLWRPEGLIPVTVSKRFRLIDGDARIEVTYEISNSHPASVETWFAVENNFNFQAGHADDRYILIDSKRPVESFLDSPGVHSSALSWVLADEYRDIAVGLTADIPGEIWHTPIFTVSLSEGGFEKVYQGTTLVNRFRLQLNAQPVRLVFRLTTGRVKQVTM